ncbi:MAG: hypothetical protein H7145_22585 [Akkermansiaceae bacterium]|nr:hypothetical protein [Armatimonadota bacterium]
MPYILELEPNEQIRTDIHFAASEKSPLFRLAISDRAVYIPATKFVISGDPNYFKRVPLGNIDILQTETIKPYGFYFFSVVMILFALFMMSTIFFGGGISPRTIGWTLALLVGGTMLPFAGRGRYRLAIKMGKETYRWIPPLVVFPQDRRKANEVLDNILDTSRSVGITVNDTRERLQMPLPPASE